MSILNIGRLIIGIFYLVACIFNLFHTINNTEYMWTVCLENTRFSFQKEFLEKLIIPNEKLVILLIVIFEFVTSMLILSSGNFVKVGLILGIVWVLFVAQFLPKTDILGHLFLGMIQGILLVENYNKTLLEIIIEILAG